MRATSLLLAAIPLLFLSCAAGKGCLGGRVIADPNEYGGRTTRIETPASPESRFVELAKDRKGRIRNRRVGYPENFLKEDPRIEGSFSFDESGRLTRAEYRFSEAFASANRGLVAQVLIFSPDRRVIATEFAYDGRDSAMKSLRIRGGPPGELPRFSPGPRGGE